MRGSHGGRALFLDRDGTIIEDVGYLADTAHMRLLPGAAQAIARANGAGWPVVVITNQSGVARGYFSEDFARAGGPALAALLAPHGARLDGYYFSPQHPDGQPPYNVDSPDRKPGAGLLHRAARELALHLPGSYMIGDKRSDVDTGAAEGVVPLLVRTGEGRSTERALPANFAVRGGQVLDDLAAAIDQVLATPKG